MTTWTLSELTANESCGHNQPVVFENKAHDCPVVVVDSGASIEAIPFWGLVDIGENK
jgi:hypothetical protein